MFNRRKSSKFHDDMIIRAVGATDSATGVDWTSTMELCDAANSPSEKIGKEILSGMKRFFKDKKDMKFALRALIVLEALMNNCDSRIHALVCHKKWMDRLMNLYMTALEPEVTEKVLQLMSNWRFEFSKDSDFSPPLELACTSLTATIVRELPPPTVTVVRTEKAKAKQPPPPSPSHAYTPGPRPSSTSKDKKFVVKINPQGANSDVKGGIPVAGYAGPYQYSQEFAHKGQHQNVFSGSANTTTDDVRLHMAMIQDELEGRAQHPDIHSSVAICRSFVPSLQQRIATEEVEASVVEFIELNEKLNALLETWDAAHPDSPKPEPFLAQPADKAAAFKLEKPPSRQSFSKESPGTATTTTSTTSAAKSPPPTVPSSPPTGDNVDMTPEQELIKLRKANFELLSQVNDLEMKVVMAKSADGGNDGESSAVLEKYKAKAEEMETIAATLKSENDTLKHDHFDLLMKISELESGVAAAPAASKPEGEVEAPPTLDDDNGDQATPATAASTAADAETKPLSAIQSAELETIMQQKSEVEAVNAQLQEQVTQLEEAVALVTANRDEFHTQLEKVIQERDLLQSAQNDEALATAIAERDHLMTVVAEANGNIEIMNDQVRQLVTERDTALQQVADIAAERDQIVAQAGGAQEKLAIVTAHAKALQASVTTLREERESLKQSTSQLVTDFSTHLEAAQSQISARVTKELQEIAAKERKKMEGEIEYYKQMYKKESKLRKKLHNTVCELKGNIRVSARVRPLLEHEIGDGVETVFKYGDDGEITIIDPNKLSTDKVFEFDHVFTPESTQEQVFEETSMLITSMLDGYNVCLFAYGQTGSGKTFTMVGYDENIGILYRAIQTLFERIEEMSDKTTVKVYLNMLEIYNETIKDLLNPDAPSDTKYDVKTDATLGMYVSGLVSEEIASPADAKTLIDKGNFNRTSFATAMNEHSSRSHMLIGFVAHVTNTVTGDVSVGKLQLCDLAGSERVSKSEATGDRLKEAQAINKSLSALGDVMAALSTNNSHIPYRNSKLTYLLQDSLGGNSKVMMFCNLNPHPNHSGETVCSLNFAHRAKTVELGQAKKNVKKGSRPSTPNK
eukprot:GFYU01004853.1.p1 GENE.GFYU01004853.1~~GFYU01004853.1.p1  ORF type:complete len:1085 (-),score=370.11 GFYU01004853.1:129-3383(-)